MTEAQWYHILLEETVLKESIDDDHRYIPCRVELANPENDWETSWRRMRIKGLESEVVSFCLNFYINYWLHKKGSQE